MHRFDGKVAFVTGGANGIGLGCVERLAREGAAVMIADIDEDAAGQQAERLRSEGGRVAAARCDVTDRASIEAAVAGTLREFGGIDVLVNDVGVAGYAAFEDEDDDEWNRQLDPTLRGAMRVIQACLPSLLAAEGGGRAVAIASVNGLTAVGEVAYSAAKAGLIMAHRNLAVEYSPAVRGTTGDRHGWARFNLVAPGTIETRVWQETDEQRASLERLRGFYPMGRVGTPDDIAAAVAFLASDDAAWITGTTLTVDGGFTTGPYFTLATAAKSE